MTPFFRIRNIFLVFIIPFFFLSCSTDFNPNAEWEETTLVYGFLEPDKDTTWVRIQKCFLGEGSMLEFAKIKDSNYYQEGELVVTLKEYEIGSQNPMEKGNATGKEFVAKRTVIPGTGTGDFYNDERPLYFFETKDAILSNNIYELKIENIYTGNIVTALTIPINSNEIWISSHTSKFTFEKLDRTDRYAEVKYKTHTSAEMYQLSFRFFYQKKDEEGIFPVDLRSGIQKRGSNQELSSNFYQSTLLSKMRSEFKDYPAKSLIMYDTVEMILSAGDKRFSNYMELNNSQQEALQEKPIYTNINNGIGVFASRLTNIKNTVAFDNRTITSIRDSLVFWFD